MLRNFVKSWSGKTLNQIFYYLLTLQNELYYIIWDKLCYSLKRIVESLKVWKEDTNREKCKDIFKDQLYLTATNKYFYTLKYTYINV